MSDTMAGVWLKRLDENKGSGITKASRTRSGTLSERKSRLTFSFGIDLEQDINAKARGGKLDILFLCNRYVDRV